MISGSYVIVAIGFKASDRVVLFKLEVVHQPLQKVSLVRHFLQTGEEARLAWLGCCLFDSGAHVNMVSDLSNSDSGLWVSVQDLCDKVLALCAEELGHLVVSTHDFLV